MIFKLFKKKNNRQPTDDYKYTSNIRQVEAYQFPYTDYEIDESIWPDWLYKACRDRKFFYDDRNGIWVLYSGEDIFIVDHGDFIVIESDSSMYVMTPEKFQNTFSKLEKGHDA